MYFQVISMVPSILFRHRVFVREGGTGEECVVCRRYRTGRTGSKDCISPSSPFTGNKTDRPDKLKLLVVQKMDNTIHQINQYPLDSATGFAITYPLDSDLSGG